MDYLDYLRMGWSLLPMKFVKDVDGSFVKKPMTKWTELQTNQPTEDEVEKWLSNGWFLGIVCGELSGITIVDDDRVKRGLNEWGLTSSVVAQTKSGGKHYYFKHSGERNTVNKKIYLDVRGEGGYAVVPPSNSYVWLSEPTPENLANLKPMPDELKKLIYPTQQEGEHRHIELDEVFGADLGSRDQSLFDLGMHFCHKLPEQYWSEVRQIMHLSNQHSNSPVNEATVDEKFRQAVKYAKNNKVEEPSSEVIKPQSFREVGLRRIEDRKLERIAPTTGYTDLDKGIKGFVPGRLMVLSGDTNIGKSGLAANFAYNVARQGKRALYFALEPDRMITEYLVSIQDNKGFDDIVDGDLVRDMPGVDIITANQVKTSTELAKQIALLPRYDLVIVDHLGYFTGDGDNKNDTESEILIELAQAAQNKMSTVMVIAHLNKTFDVTSKNWIPRMNQIKGTSSFKQDCDEVLLLGRKPIETEYGNIKYGDFGVLVVGKTKSGGDGSVCPLRFYDRKALIAGVREVDTVHEDLDISIIKKTMF